MADAIGPGMMVEAVDTTTVPPGTRAWVLEVEPPELSRCDTCGLFDASTIILTISRPPAGHRWCPNHWRLVGGDFEEPIRTEERTPEHV